ncbi:MAG TPA: enoyl-CoA hydratase/isomerase family protein [Vicinamibacteria bacterium]|nr:enoyl-CoA hydratase/isomerase family protein [Vicinamibacteria bacterium]
MAEELPDIDAREADLYATRRNTEYKLVQFVSAQGVARLTLNRPQANVLSVEVLDELVSALEALEYQRDVKLLVVSAVGKYFSAGFELGDHIGDRAYVMLEQFHRLVEVLASMDKPSLAVVAGPALGAGCMLAAACDMTLAGASVKFALPEIKGGVFNTVAAALLPRIVGRKKAFEMILGGLVLTAADAEKAGLISRAVPDERLEAEAAAVIQRFQEGSAPLLQCARRALAGGLELLPPDALRHAEDVYLNQLMATEDVEEGLQAVLARRKPVWKDR